LKQSHLIQLRDLIYTGLLVREGQTLTEAIARERANNICVGVAEFADELVTEAKEDCPCGNGGNESNEGSPSPGSGSSGPVSTAGRSTGTAATTGNGSRVAGAAGTTQSETMQAHADRVIR